MATEFAALARLIAPTTTDAFFRDYWEAKPLVVARAQPSYFDDLLTLDELDRVITTYQLSHPDLSVANAGRDVKVPEYTYPSGMIDVARLYQQFAAGGTIILNQLQRFVPPLAALCGALEREASTRFQTNIYLTPREARGLRTHYDSHDVIVLQIHGTKHWTLYDTPVELPYRQQSFGQDPVTPGAVSREFDLNPGDTLYLPRGVMHDAATTSVDSVHVTVGVLQTSWTELLMEAMGRVGMEDAAFRKGLPVGFGRAGFDRAAARATFRDLVDRFAARAELDGALDHFSDELLLNTREALLRGQLHQVRRLGEVTVDSRVGVRSNLAHRIHETEDAVVVSANANDVRLPPHAAEALTYALSHDDYAVRDLPGELDDAGKLVLVKRLVREGLARLL